MLLFSESRKNVIEGNVFCTQMSNLRKHFSPWELIGGLGPILQILFSVICNIPSRTDKKRKNQMKNESTRLRNLGMLS